jgi:hypothetical protein
MGMKPASRLFMASLLAGLPAFAIPDPLVQPTLNPVRVEASPGGEGVTLVKSGAPAATLVIPAEDVPIAVNQNNSLNRKTIVINGREVGTVARFAAEEFVLHLKKATGATLPIVTDADPVPQGTLVLIGESRLTKEKGLSAADLPLEGFRVQTFPGGLAILGRLPDPKNPEIGSAGTIYGVYDVLERFLGIRWYYPGDDGRVVPESSGIVIPPCRYSDQPFRIKRHGTVDDRMVKGVSEDMHIGALRYRVGVSTPVTTGCHTPHNFGIHAKDFPEVMELAPDGRRDKYMPCYGNPKTLELMIRDLEAFYSKGVSTPWLHPNGVELWGPPNRWTVHISPPDKEVDCKCQFCAPKMEPNAGRYERASRLMAEFVDQYALAIQARWPDKRVFYLPYSNYTTPPKDFVFKSRNVVAGICLMRGAANDKVPEVAAEHDAMIAGWAKATGRNVHLWDYACWPAMDTALPFQYPHILQAFQRRHLQDIDGAVLNGGGADASLPGSDWQVFHPTLYCWFRLMWNPDFNVDAALEEYVRRMYGDARAPMSDLLTLLTDRWEKIPWSSAPAGWHVSPKMIHEETMPRKEALQLKDLLAQARARAPEGSVERRRVEFFGQAVDLFLQESDNYHTGAGLPTLMVLKVGANPTVDGRLDDACWRNAERQTFKRARAKDPEPVAGKTESAVQAVWTATGITFAFKFMDPDPTRLAASIQGRDQPGIWWEDSIEVFLDPEGQRSRYYQFIANAGGGFYDTCSMEETFNASGARIATSRGADHWTMEIFLPYEDFTAGLLPGIGSIWYANFIRDIPPRSSKVAVGADDYEMVYQRWSTNGKPSHLDFSAFGKLRFVE